VEAKQKNYKEEKKLRKSYEASLFLLEACVFFIGFSSPRILGKYYGLDFVNNFSVSNSLEFLYFVEALLLI